MIYPVPKPKKPRKPSVKVFPDGREVCNRNTTIGRTIYRKRLREMVFRQNNLCALCGKFLMFGFAEFDHEHGRGLGGGNRDDRIERKGRRYNAAVCPQCNMEKGSKRIPYRFQ